MSTNKRIDVRMYAISFDLDPAIIHAQKMGHIYSDIDNLLHQYGFQRLHNHVYCYPKEDMAHVFNTLNALKNLAGFAEVVKEIYTFRMEQWSEFTSFIKAR